MSRARFSAGLISEIRRVFARWIGVTVIFAPLAARSAIITQTVNSSADTTGWKDAI